MNFSTNFWPYALYDMGISTMRLDPNILDYPEFANIAIKKSVYKNITINTMFGNQSSLFKVFGGEDPDFIEKAKKISQIYYLPSMSAYHHIKPSRFTKSYFYWKYWEFGKERALLEKIYSKTPSTTLFSYLRYLKSSLFKRMNLYQQTQLLFMSSYLLASLYITFIGLKAKTVKT
jgi:hypothetical protein